MITEIVRYTIDPAEAPHFEAAYRAAAEVLRSSGFCLGCEIIRGVEHPENWIVILRWESVDAHLNGFRKSPSFKTFVALVRPYFESIQEMDHYTTTATVWDRATAATADVPRG